MVEQRENTAQSTNVYIGYYVIHITMRSSHLKAFINIPTTEVWSGNDHGLPILPEETCPLSYNSELRVPRSYHRAWVPQGQNTQIVLFGGDSSEAMNTADVVGGAFHLQSQF